MTNKPELWKKRASLRGKHVGITAPTLASPVGVALTEAQLTAVARIHPDEYHREDAEIACSTCGHHDCSCLRIAPAPTGPAKVIADLYRAADEACGIAPAAQPAAEPWPAVGDRVRYARDLDGMGRVYGLTARGVYTVSEVHYTGHSERALPIAVGLRGLPSISVPVKCLDPAPTAEPLAASELAPGWARISGRTAEQQSYRHSTGVGVWQNDRDWSYGDADIGDVRAGGAPTRDEAMALALGWCEFKDKSGWQCKEPWAGAVKLEDGTWRPFAGRGSDYRTANALPSLPRAIAWAMGHDQPAPAVLESDASREARERHEREAR